MKKRIALIVLMLTICMAFSSCAVEETTDVSTTGLITEDEEINWVLRDDLYDYSGYDIDKYSVHVLSSCDCTIGPVEYGTWYKFYDKERYANVAPEEILTVTINGQEYTGFDPWTRNDYRNYFPQHRYSIEIDGVRSGTFAVDDRGKVIGFSAPKNQGETTEVCSEEECIDKAKKFIEEISGEEKIDWSYYKITASLREDLSEYFIEIKKYIDDFETTERLIVYISLSGRVTRFSSTMFGRIPNDIDLSVFDMETVKMSAYNKLDDAYKYFIKVRYELAEPIVSVLWDGTPCLIYETNTFVKAKEDGVTYGELVSLVVIPNN